MMAPSQSPLYHKLSTPTSIRLLSLEPAIDGGIEAQLVIVETLADSPPYQALSYEWGDASNPAIIQCNGSEVEVTRNLSNALRRLRPLPKGASSSPKDDLDATDSTVDGLNADDNVWSGIATRQRELPLDERTARSYLWIDALCINQKDEEERTSQVLMMRQIYETAETVLVWLGEGGPDPIYAVSFIAQALQNLEDERRRCEGTWKGVETENFSRVVNRGRGFKNLYGDDFGYQNRHWGALARFCDNTYFLRVWIIQEIAVAKRVKVIFGDFDIAFDALGAAAVWFIKKGYVDHAPKLGGLRDVAFLWLRNQSTKNRKRIPLLDLIQETQRYQATRPVDKIFALLGLAQEGEGNHALLRIDYEKPEADVFRDVTRFLVYEYNTLKPLVFVNHENVDKTIQQGNPTWASSPGASLNLFEVAYRTLSASSGILPSQPYRAGSDEPVVLKDSSSLRTLTVRGIFVDTVETCSAPLRFRDQDDWERPNMCKMFKALTKYYDESKVYPHTGQELIDTFLLTCTASTPTRSLYMHKERGERPYTVATLLAEMYQFAGANQRKRTGQGFEKGPAFLEDTCANRTMFITENGYLGVGPVGMQSDDVIVVPFGGELIFVLRKTDNESGYLFVGNSYVHGLMNGEAIHDWRNGKLEDKYFALL